MQIEIMVIAVIWLYKAKDTFNKKSYLHQTFFTLHSKCSFSCFLMFLKDNEHVCVFSA